MNKKVENKQKKLAILLRTMTNGYMLEVNNEGYMYFNAQSLQCREEATSGGDRIEGPDC